jgi:hypothetical protein
MMHDKLRDLLPDDISDETAHQLTNILYELALAFESIHLGKIMRYQKSLIELRDDLVGQVCIKKHRKEEELQDPPF